jgi:defect-in-organelle-trafficking protein DotA
MYKVFYLILLLIAPDIFASSSNIFTPVAGDESVTLLGVIFGANVGSITLGTAAANTAMGDVMEQLNIVVVALGTIIVSYVGIMSTINTAQEGAIMGKKWSAVWIPMRSIAGMALLIPSSGSGYSMIQVTVMYIVMQGIGAADFLWNVILQDLASGVSVVSGSGSTTTTGSTNSAAPNGPTAAQITDPNTGIGLQILSALVCMQTLRNVAALPTNTGTWLGNNGHSIQSYTDPTTSIPVTPTSGNPAVTTVTVSSTIHFGVPNQPTIPYAANLCGSFTISGQASNTDFTNAGSTTVLDPQGSALTTYATDIYVAKSTALNSILNEFQNQLVAPIVAGTTPPAGLVNTAGAQYVNIVNVPIPGTDPNKAIDAAVSSGEANGWIVAGSYYFVFSQTLSTKIFPNLASPPSAGGLPSNTSSVTPNMPMCTSNMQVTGGTCQSLALSGTTPGPGVAPTDGWGDPSNPPSAQTAAGAYLSQLNQFMTNADDIALLSYNLASTSNFWNIDLNVGGVSTPLNIPVAGAAAGTLQSALGPIAASNNAIITNLINLMSNDNGDPLIAHALFGQSVMFGCEIAWIAIFASSIIVSMGVGFLGWAIGLPTILMGLLAVMSAFLGTMWAFGATLAIYCPLIPFFIFTIGALGWMLTVTEAVIGAPLIALSLVVPAGDELGRLESALSLLANIFLRPTLMLIGFALAGKVYRAIITLVDLGFGATLNSINIGTLFSPVVVLGAYCMFDVSLTNNCFSLIYSLPDKILRWMGGQAENTDASSLQAAEGGAKSGGEGVSNQVGKGGGEAGNAMMKGAQERKARLAKAGKGRK